MEQSAKDSARTHAVTMAGRNPDIEYNEAYGGH